MEMDKVDKNWWEGYFRILGRIQSHSWYTFGRNDMMYIVKDKLSIFWLNSSNNTLLNMQNILYYQYNFSSLWNMEYKSHLRLGNTHQSMLHMWLNCSRCHSLEGRCCILCLRDNILSNKGYKHWAFLMYHNLHNFLCYMPYNLRHLGSVLHCNLNM